MLKGQPTMALFSAVLIFALVRGFLRYAEQACNHFIAFKLLALIRDKVFGALRRLCPAKLEGKDKGDLISIITSDIELLEMFYAHTISPICIAALFTLVMVSFIGSCHMALGILALAAYITVGVLIPIVTSRLGGDDGIRLRTKSGALSGFVLDSLRGLSETIQYGQGEKRLDQMNAQTDDLSRDEARMKRTAGRNTAVTNTVILIFDLAMLFLSAKFVGFEGCLITTLALMSSFGPVVALAALRATLQNTFAAGNRVLDILDESPVVEEITGREEVQFHGASAEKVTFAYGEETILDSFSVEIPVLPTVPFLMLAAFCFARSSEKLDRWFRETKLYKDNLEDLVAGHGMTVKAKLRIMAAVTALMGAGFLMMGLKGIVTGCIVLGCVWVLHILYFIFGIKTIPAAEVSAV